MNVSCIVEDIRDDYNWRTSFENRTKDERKECWEMYKGNVLKST